jgi:hypothetical protein
MVMHRPRCALAVVLAVGLAGTSHGREPAGPEAFLRHLYAPYVAGDTTADPTGKPAPTIFDARLTALIRRDQANAHGEVGALDGDPICDCQDFGPLKALSIKIQPLGPHRALGPHRVKASVRFINLNTATALTYELTRTGAGWRVTDIASPDMPSLVGLLKAGTARK